QPLLPASKLTAVGESPPPGYGGRSIPHGIDLLAPLAGHPLHPLFGSASMRAYETLGQNYIEVIAWIGVVPLLLLATTRLTAENAEHAEQRISPISAISAVKRETRLWRIVAVAFL